MAGSIIESESKLAKAEMSDKASPAPATMMDKLSNYIIVDIGANLTNKKFSRDLDQVIQRAREAGVTKIMVTGTSLHSTKEALRLTRLYPGTLYSTAGESHGQYKQITLIFVTRHPPSRRQVLG